MNLEEPFDCRQEPGCDRTQALPDDLLRYAERWDRQALEALGDFDRVRQPLAELIDPRFHNAVRTAVEQGILLDSIASTACESFAPRPTPAGSGTRPRPFGGARRRFRADRQGR